MSRINGEREINPAGPAPRVDLIDDVDLAVRVFRRGTRGLGDTCQLTLSVNGREITEMNEEVGDGAPAFVVVDVRMPEAIGCRLIAALEARPWLYPELPVIIFSGAQGEVQYLVRTPTVNRVIATIAAELDLIMPLGDQSTLDAVGYRG